MTKDNFYSQYPQICEKLAKFYGLDEAQTQLTWLIQTVLPNHQNEWHAFSWLVENCLKETDDYELDFLWFSALKENHSHSKAA
jgi:hypothetical protein